VCSSDLEAFGGLPVNTKGLTYKKYALEYEKLDEKEKIAFMIKNPSMIKRPILQKEKTVLCFGFNEKDFDQKLGK
jgi:arsenate reductase-like glutaredoxin family protein